MSFARALLVGGLLFAFTIFLTSGSDGLRVLVLLAAITTAVLASLWVHQLGHLLAAWIVGLKTRAFYLWPFYFYRRNGWKATMLSSRYLLADGGPFVETLEGVRGKMVVALLGGPALSLLAGGIAAAFMGSFPSELFPYGPSSEIQYPHSTAFTAYFVSMFAILSLTYFLLSILPLREYGRTWDGVFLATLYRGGDRAKRALATYALQCVSDSRRPRDWPAEWLEAARDPSETNDGIFWLRQLYEHRLDLGQMDEAKATLDEVIRIGDANPIVYTAALRIERIFLYAWLGLDDFDLKACYEENVQRSNDWKANYKAKAMLWLLEGKPEQAIKVGVTGRDFLRDHWDEGISAMNAEWFDRIIERAFAEKGTPPPSSEAESG